LGDRSNLGEDSVTKSHGGKFKGSRKRRVNIRPVTEFWGATCGIAGKSRSKGDKLYSSRRIGSRVLVAISKRKGGVGDENREEEGDFIAESSWRGKGKKKTKTTYRSGGQGRRD